VRYEVFVEGATLTYGPDGCLTLRKDSSEGIANAVGDAVVAHVGWWVLMFEMSRCIALHAQSKAIRPWSVVKMVSLQEMPRGVVGVHFLACGKVEDSPLLRTASPLLIHRLHSSPHLILPMFS